jgi:hypothetical protein
MGRIIIGFGLGAAVAFVLFATVGVATSLRTGPPITAVAVEAALDFAFPDASLERNQWHSVSGTAHHGWLLRRAYVEGRLGSVSGERYSEQVLKVGLPFTVVRGFIRTVGDEVERDGARLVSRVEHGRPARLVPMKPVWPGVALYGFLGVLAAIRTGRRREDPHRSGVSGKGAGLQ